MGRPINKRFIGPATAGGAQIRVQFHNGIESVEGYIVKQTGSKRFICSDGKHRVTCYLVDVPAAELQAGQMSIAVKDDEGNVKRLTKFAAKKATASDGTVHKWTFEDAEDVSSVVLEKEHDGSVTEEVEEPAEEDVVEEESEEVETEVEETETEEEDEADESDDEEESEEDK